MEFIIYFLPIILSITHIIGQYWDVEDSIFKYLRSFASGLSVSYVFLVLMPEVLVNEEFGLINLLALMLAGFTAAHLLSKHTFRHADAGVGNAERSRFHGVMMVFSGFITTFILIEIAQEDIRSGLAIFIPLVLHSLLAEIVITELDGRVETLVLKFAVIAAPLVAGSISFLGLLGPVAAVVLMAFAVGVIIYMDMEEELPRGKSGNPYLFLAGVLLMWSWVFAVL